MGSDVLTRAACHVVLKSGDSCGIASMIIPLVSQTKTKLVKINLNF